jgi:DnaJ-class molecular chaperone
MNIEEAYHILGVDGQASKAEARAAYRRKALEFHPDRHASGQDKAYYAQKFKELKEAYELLKRGEAPAPVPEIESKASSRHRFAGRSFTRQDGEQVPLAEKLGIGFSWNMESLILWGIVIPLAALVLIFVIRFFASL